MLQSLVFYLRATSPLIARTCLGWPICVVFYTTVLATAICIILIVYSSHLAFLYTLFDIRIVFVPARVCYFCMAVKSCILSSGGPDRVMGHTCLGELAGNLEQVENECTIVGNLASITQFIIIAATISSTASCLISCIIVSSFGTSPDYGMA